MSVPTERATRRAGQMTLRRWITLVSAGWLPHFISSSRGCLGLRTGIIALDAHAKFSRVPLIVPAHRVAGSVAAFSGVCAVLSLPGWFSAAWVSSRERFNLSGDVPDKAAQLARDGYTDFVLRQLASRAQMFEALGQAQLRAPGDIAYGFRLTLLPHFQWAAHSGRVAIGPSRLDQDSAGVLPALVMLP